MHGKNTCGSTLLLNSSNLASFRTALVLERNLLLLESGDWRVPVSSAVPRLLLFEEGQPTRALFPLRQETSTVTLPYSVQVYI